jgi:hypothetical protein
MHLVAARAQSTLVQPLPVLMLQPHQPKIDDGIRELLRGARHAISTYWEDMARGCRDVGSCGVAVGGR